MNRALIIKTDQTLEIIEEYTIISVNIDYIIPYHIPSKKAGRWFYLSNGEHHHEEDLIIGQTNIRDYKLNEII